jgi:hypothetical protein
MAESFSEKGDLPACRLDKELFEEIWDLLGQDGEPVWEAIVGTGGDLLGQQTERPQERVDEKGRLLELLAVLPRIDSLQFTAEVTGKGAVSFTFRNTIRPAGALVVASEDPAWAATRFEAISDMFTARRDGLADKLYSRWAYGFINTAIPLAAASLIVVLAVAIIVPASVRQSEWLWWITGGSVILTMWLGVRLSNKLLAYVIREYPYIRWRS